MCLYVFSRFNVIYLAEYCILDFTHLFWSHEAESVHIGIFIFVAGSSFRTPPNGFKNEYIAYILILTTVFLIYVICIKKTHSLDVMFPLNSQLKQRG